MEIQEYIDRKLTHQVHTSERRSFRSCRRRWNWVYREMYYPKVTPEPLEFGVAFHKAMEYLYAPTNWHDKFTAKNLAIVAFRRECEKQLRIYSKLNGEPDTDVLQNRRDRIELGINMIRYYAEEVAPQYDKNFTPIGIEVEFEVPLENPDTGVQLWCTCEQCLTRTKTFIGKNFPGEILNPDDLENWPGLPVTYGGRLDMIAKDNIGRVFVYDWKTTSRILDEDAESSFLQLDDQITSYCWALWKLGYDIAGFVYVEIKKTYPKPPELLSRPYKGRLFSTNKQNLTDYRTFKETVEIQDDQGYQCGLYDEYLQWLKDEGPKFTQRHQIHRNRYELENAGRNIALEAMDMTQSPRVYPQPGRFSCPTCLFRQPCVGTNMNEDVTYLLDNIFERRRKHYWEEEEPSTE